MASTTSTTISSLPTEMLSHIFGFLDTPSPSDLRLHDQPHAHMLKNPDISSQNLKNLSLVNHQWRAIVLPLLFRHVVWYLDRFDLMQIEQFKSDPDADADADATPLRSFVQANNLTPYINTLTLVVVKSTRGRAANGGSHYAYSPDPLGGPVTRAGGERDVVFNEDSNWLWDLIFAVIDPLRFTLIASPRMLASLLARMLFLGDEWSFNQSHHLLSLSRVSRKTTSHANTQPEPQPEPQPEAEAVRTSASPSTSTPASTPSSSGPSRRVPCALFTIRPWDALLLNEGSSTGVYKTYEYFHKRPPSMLGALLGAEEFPNNDPLITPSIRDLSYVGIFPLSTHFNTLVQNLPRIDRLFVQLVPRNDILKDKREMEHLDMDTLTSDLWAERNTSYGKIMPKLFDSSSSAGNWRYLQVFESGDAADRESWEMAVEYVRQFSAEWRVEREGVFVKRQPGDEDKSFNEENQAGNHSTILPPFHGYTEDDELAIEPGSAFFRGALRRFAFAGATRLPLSSVWLYLQNTNP
ncbi:hypothetical protein VM1G_08646 [Cytospora mali]|uniref:F-box domain-containing protein n=1 Tax=Cytospora mali TaxID=578113 RepID=A0A194W919_CYTMA|nr:hypothetical protein VM1G_08646 [Valsa mali]